MPLPLVRLTQNTDFLLRGSAEVAVHARQWFEFPSHDNAKSHTWCYTDQLSYVAGEVIRLHAISTAKSVDIEIHLGSQKPKCVLRYSNVTIGWATTREDASVNGCNWPVIKDIPVSADWPSGAYRIVLRTKSEAAGLISAQHLIVIRPQHRPNSNRLLLVTADSTWNAYNDWGGSNHYEGIVNPNSNRFSTRLSNQRPFARGFITLPGDAPRTLPRQCPEYGDPPVYQHMNWAWTNGYSKKYASAGWASYERHFVLWAQKNNYPLDIATQQDLHFRPEIIDDYACLVMVGHDEYWSWQMRDTIDDYVEAGGNVARFAGNFLWQIRLENQGKIQICHKYLAREQDNFYKSDDQHLTTNCWESDEVGRPGHSTFGLDASRGMYAGWGGLAANGSGGFTLYRPQHWAFDHCRLGYGDLLGSRARIFGYEVDGLDYRIEDGLPVAIQKPTLPENLEILALGLARMREDAFNASAGTLFVGDDDARFMADLIYGEVNSSLLDRVDGDTA